MSDLHRDCPVSVSASVNPHHDQVLELCRHAREAQRWLAGTTTGQRNELLELVATNLTAATPGVLLANTRDVEREQQAGMSAGLLDRLTLTESRVLDLAAAVRDLIGLPDPVGAVVSGQTTATGLRVRRVRVPMGVVGMIYEARPNVTVDAACLCLKSANAVVLRGGSAAKETNAALVQVLKDSIREFGGDHRVVATIDGFGREGARTLMGARGLIDVLVPRGGAGLIESVVTNAKVPVIETGVGNCHIYVDASADLAVAERIVMNAKTQRVGVCNAAETLLVHAGVAGEFLPKVAAELFAAGVCVHACPQAHAILDTVPGAQDQLVEATGEDWDREYLSLDLAVAVVEDVQAAIEHIRAHSTGHTEAVLATDTRVINRFVAEVDAAAIAVNASTRFTDGGQLGLGAELGISTQKLHARGPMGLEELTTWTWIIEGDGHVRG